ncbi:SMP-30/gluconolactonase/LRE family protein [Spongiactinospora sp. 9N601]|uniref:SMP-30/gluconolactonase/LRE family protein n=1 Tax=Spongiactinospora sp. 9N601 TaxID=3375149 RepID=UPI0037BA7383
MIRTIKILGAALAVLLPVLTIGGPAKAASDQGATQVAASPTPPKYPTTISLPNGFRPEGIATGPGPYAYFGSLGDGSIYRADLRDGSGAIISPGPGTSSVGMKTDRRGRLFVAGGGSGGARVIDTRTGRILASYQLSSVPALINDVVVTRDAAYFTDSTNPVLYKLPLHGRRLPAAATPIPITGDLVYRPGFNANGITPTPDGRGLIVVQSNTGGLFRVDPSGATRQIDLHGETLPAGDGLLLLGRTLYAVQNQLNSVAVIRLNAEGTEGHVERRVTDPRFDVPTTVAAFGDRLYLPNARFSTPPTPETPYTAVAIPRP